MGRDYLSHLEQVVLLAVLRLGEEAHGAAIRRDLNETAGIGVTVPTLYVALARLGRQGLVRSWLTEPTPVHGGKRVRQYAVTPRGLAAVQEARRALERMWAGVDPALRPR